MVVVPIFRVVSLLVGTLVASGRPQKPNPLAMRSSVVSIWHFAVWIHVAVRKCTRDPLEPLRVTLSKPLQTVYGTITETFTGNPDGTL